MTRPYEPPEVLMDHFRNPRNAGALPDPDAEGRAVSEIHGDRLRLTFRLRGERVERVGFECLGCPVAIAAGSVATELLAGRTVAEALALGADEVAAALGGLPDDRRDCSVLAPRAVRAALGAR